MEKGPGSVEGWVGKMDFRWSDEEESVLALAREILTALVTPERFATLAARRETLDRETWQALAKANLLGVALPETVGGAGLGFLALCCLMQEVGRALPFVPALETLSVALAVEKFGTPAQRSALLSGVCDGTLVLSTALLEGFSTERTAQKIESEPTQNGDGWRVHAERTCVAYADHASRILMSLRAESGELLVLLDPRRPGVELEAMRSSTGEPWFHLRLHDVQISVGDVLGVQAQGTEILRWLGDRRRVLLCAKHLGVAERALEITAQYTAERKQFGRPIATFQAVAQRAADAFVLIEAMRLTFWQAAFLLDTEKECGLAVQTAKYWACEAGAFVAYAAQHLHGGIGVALDYPLHRYYLWSRQLELDFGSAPEQLASIGAALASESDTDLFR